jgi:phosphoribosylanthranilate isomerase
VRIRVKICGFRHPDDVVRVRGLDIDAVGVVLDAGPTQVSAERARTILARAADLDAEVVAVAGPADAARVRGLLRAGFDRVQAVLDASARAALPPQTPVLPVFFDDEDLVSRMSAFFEAAPPAELDAGAWGRANVDGRGGGGRGRAADWGRAAEAARRFPLTLSGGLTAENVGDAIRRVRPVAVDVSSYTEGHDGRKSPERIARFVEAVRAAEATAKGRA